MTRFPNGGKNFDDMFSRFDTIPLYHSVTDILPHHSQHYAWHGAVKIMYKKRNTVTNAFGKNRPVHYRTS